MTAKIKPAWSARLKLVLTKRISAIAGVAVSSHAPNLKNTPKNMSKGTTSIPWVQQKESKPQALAAWWAKTVKCGYVPSAEGLLNSRQEHAQSADLKLIKWNGWLIIWMDLLTTINLIEVIVNLKKLILKNSFKKLGSLYEKIKKEQIY